MIQVPFGLTAAIVLTGAVVTGGAIGIVSSPPPAAPRVQAVATPAPVSPPPAAASEPEAAPPSEQRSIAPTSEIVPSPAAPSSSAAIESRSSTEEIVSTTTYVPAPVIVTTWGVPGCIAPHGCFEHRDAARDRRPPHDERRMAQHVENRPQWRAPEPRREPPVAGHVAAHIGGAVGRR
jgi:hypothetical protein